MAVWSAILATAWLLVFVIIVVYFLILFYVNHCLMFYSLFFI